MIKLQDQMSPYFVIPTLSQIVQLSSSRRPASLLTLDSTPPTESTRASQLASSDGEGPTPFAITSVSWAPSCGRSYHLIATGSRDGRVRIWRVKPPLPSDELDAEEMDSSDNKWSASIVGDFDDHKCVLSPLSCCLSPL